MTRYHQYPRFFVREEAYGVNRIAKAETPDDAAQYTIDNGWHEYGSLLHGGGPVTQDGHAMGFSAETINDGD